MEAKRLAELEERHPTWELALTYPDQGNWLVAEYLELDVGRAVDFDQGHLEFQPMPDELHQAIVLFFVNALRATGLGTAIMAPFPVKLWENKFREPDVAFMRTENAERRRGKYWDGADLVVEVVSESNRKLDTETTRSEYARAAIPEYWIVDPARERITVLTLVGDAYEVAAACGLEERVASVQLPHFEVAVAAALQH